MKAVLHGKISGKKLTIEIPGFLQQPAPGTYSALNGLVDDAVEEEGQERPDLLDRAASPRSTRSASRSSYAPNPNPPAKSSASDTGDAKCS